MARRKSGTNWSWLRWLIEFNLRRHPDFQKNFRLEEKIRPLGSGLFHKNYLFEASGKDLVLRLGIVERDLQTQRQAVKSLRQEAKTRFMPCARFICPSRFRNFSVWPMTSQVKPSG